MRRTLSIPDHADLKLPKGPVGLSFSIGADSTLLFYLLMCQTDLPVHLFQVASRWLDCCELPIAADIIQWMNHKFPGRDIIHTIRYADDASEQRAMLFEEPKLALYQDDRILSFLTGLTRSPSLEVQREKFPVVLSGVNHTERNPAVKHQVRKSMSWYSPMINLDKQQVFEIYQDHHIVDLWHLTRSCTQSVVPCGECWWCAERAWATGPRV